MNCKACGHQHQGVRLAYICIGCPCPETPGRKRSEGECDICLEAPCVCAETAAKLESEFKGFAP